MPHATDKLCALRSKVSTMIPDDARVSNLWTHLGWDGEASDNYLAAQRCGLDIRPILAPVFSDLVSLVADGDLLETDYTWDDILSGEIPEFAGETPKKVVLSVINYAIRQHLA